jgi:uncharacterized protein (TIGR03118 family)
VVGPLTYGAYGANKDGVRAKKRIRIETMKTTIKNSLRAAWALPAALGLLQSISSGRAAVGYEITNLVADSAGVARFEDTNLVNPWGVFVAPGVIVASDNHSGLSTFYGLGGRPVPFTITIPPPMGGTGPAAPTGLVPNSTRGFVIMEGSRARPSRLIYATEDGTISGWNPEVDRSNAILAVDNSANGAVYKGVTLGWAGGKPFLFAANFTGGMVEIYDSNFKPAGSFTDPNVPSGFGPFGIREIQGQIFVTFAKHKPAPDQGDDLAGDGNGFVDVFDTTGKLVKQFAAHGALNSPWGLAVAPGGFGDLGGALLVGNFGNGHINAFDLQTGASLGPVSDAQGDPLVIEGLWGLDFGRQEGDDDTGGGLYFTAGPGEESHGLLGIIRPAVANNDNEDAENNNEHGNGNNEDGDNNQNNRGNNQNGGGGDHGNGGNQNRGGD